MPAFAELHQTLQDLMAAIRGGDGEALRQSLALLDRQRQEIGDEAPPMLRHYLEKRSYAKALEFLAGRDQTVRPGC